MDRARIQAQLEKIAGNPLFTSAESLRRFLRYVVESTLEGRENELKEYSIGVEVFHRGEQFDPRLDSIVRVQASKLRAKLREYYEEAGRDDPIQIELPKGTYVPVFRAREAVAARSGKPQMYGALGAGAAALVLAALIGGGTAVPRKEPPLFHSVPLTSFPGLECHAALSPDGNSVAFVWNGEREDNFDIYVMPIHGTEPVRLTTDAAADLSPAWSPDGRTLAFLRWRGEERGDLLLIAAAGGTEHKVGEVWNPDLGVPPARARTLGVAWSPDRRWIAASHRERQDLNQRIYLFSLDGERRALTAPPPGSQGDQMPSFSPDGRGMVFSRLGGYSASEIYLLPLDPRLQPAGPARGLTHAKRWAMNPSWTRDGRHILYLLQERPEALNARALHLIGASGDPASERTLPLPEPLHQLSVGRHLVYSHLARDANIWRATLPRPGQGPRQPELFLASTFLDWKPSYSPDGTKIAFTSERSGTPEIWVAEADGSHAVRVTTFGGALLGPARWSPGGQWLVFHARPEGQADLFAVPAAGGPPRRLTTDEADDLMPSYSHDGRWIYFSSRRSGKDQIWKMPSAGGEAQELTKAGGQTAQESANGETIYFLRESAGTIWEVSAEGGEEKPVVGPVHDPDKLFAVTAEGIYYVAPPVTGRGSFIRFFSFAKGESREVAEAPEGVGMALSVSPDGRYLLFDQWDKPKQDLMLVEGFAIP